MAGRTALPVSEKEFQKQVVEIARMYGWKVAHFRTAQVAKDVWVTPMLGDKGFPDLVLVRGTVLVFAELKVGYNKTTPEQAEWLEALSKTRARVYVWTPEHWPAIKRALEGKR